MSKESKFKSKDFVEFKRVFKSFDTDGSGTIDKNEMAKVLGALKLYGPFTLDACRELSRPEILTLVS